MSMHSTGMYPRRTPRKRKSEPVPLKLMLLVPVVIVAALWAGYHFTQPGGGAAGVGTDHGAAHPTAATDAGPNQSAGSEGTPAALRARADSSSSKEEDPLQRSGTFTM